MKNVTSLLYRRTIRGLLLVSGLSCYSAVMWAQSAAPVPAEVAIARPGQADIDRARAALDRFKQTLDAETGAILRNYPELVAVRPPRINTAVVPNLSGRFAAKHELNLDVARQGDIDLLFMGDSITDFWRNDSGNFAGKPVFDRYFGHWKVANFGIAGDTTEGVLYRLQNGEGQGFSPKAVMLMIGTNNTRLNTAPEIAEGIGAVVLALKKDFPAAKILLLAVFPRSTHDAPVRAEIQQINDIISRLDDDETVFYRDIGAIFLDGNGDIPPAIMSDGLHPTTRGYELWAEAVIGSLTELMH